MALPPNQKPAPAIRDPQNILTPFDRQTAGTGGIQRISACRSARGRFEVSVEGILLPALWRKPGTPPKGQVRAPDFNSQFIKKQGAGDLRSRWATIDLYQMAHLWGPGFGDETPAGMMWAPREINLDIQNARLEAFLRDYSEDVAQGGSGVRLKATAIAWDWQDNVADFLHFAEYEVSPLSNGAGYGGFTATLEAPAPGIPGLGTFKVERQA